MTWQKLGTFDLTSGNLSVLASDVANGAVIADAVRILRVGDLPPTPPPAPAQIIDNGDAGFSTTGPWYAYPAEGYQNDMHYAWPGTGGQAQWAATLTPGQYEVAITWYPAGNRATNASFTVRDSGAVIGATTINQQLA